MTTNLTILVLVATIVSLASHFYPNIAVSADRSTPTSTSSSSSSTTTTTKRSNANIFKMTESERVAHWRLAP